MNEFIISLNGNKNKLNFISDSKVMYNGEELEFELIETINNVYLLRIAEKLYNFSCTYKNDESIVLFSQSDKFELTVRTTLQEKASEVLAQKLALHHHLEVKAPMPGMILKVKKNNGDQVDHGEAVIILEAMKMENEIRSVNKGIIKEIFVKEGAAVEKGAILFSVEN
jgi:biotin carboxyl carrier protein